MKKYLTKSKQETQEIAAAFAKSIKRGDVVALYGELGAGKTTFTQGAAQALGIRQKITSPTFVLMKEYKIAPSIGHSGKQSASRIPTMPRLRGAGRFRASRNDIGERGIQNLTHIDCYRLKSADDAEGLGLEEIFADPGSLIFIEWPERIESLLPKKRINIYFKHLGGDEREITINN